MRGMRGVTDDPPAWPTRRGGCLGTLLRLAGIAVVGLTAAGVRSRTRARRIAASGSRRGDGFGSFAFSGAEGWGRCIWRGKRFEQEMRATARVEHPNTVRLYDSGALDGGFYLAMEYLPGLTLRAVIDAGAPLPPVRAARIALRRPSRRWERSRWAHRSLRDWCDPLRALERARPFRARDAARHLDGADQRAAPAHRRRGPWRAGATRCVGDGAPRQTSGASFGRRGRGGGGARRDRWDGDPRGAARAARGRRHPQARSPSEPGCTTSRQRTCAGASRR